MPGNLKAESLKNEEYQKESDTKLTEPEFLNLFLCNPID
jgi:hypothetical protein